MPKILANNPVVAHLVLRLSLGVVFLSHAIARIWWERVSALAGILATANFPASLALAWAITVAEIIAGLMLIFGFWVRIAVLYFLIEISASIWLVHWKHGWFSIGFGVNGIEYPIVLLAALCALFFTDR